ncbi:hypothetical protein [Pseudoalteromonas sp. ZZD1]|uniref:hypothetical protein n=1 Tax=Pseudoalteromonas sp. ZZD1 TaxID=3139395 RepID=UPI003BAB7E68
MISEIVEVSKLSLPVIAMASVFIAWQQYSANREKLRLDLYDRRFKIYDLVVHSIYNVQFGLGDYEGDEMTALYTAFNEAKFLLPDDIYKVVKKAEINTQVHREFLRRRERLEGMPENESELIKVQKAIEELEPKLDSLRDELTEAFSRVLKIKKF